MAERKALGKGFSALLGSGAGDAALEKIYRVRLEDLRPDPEQPRKEMDEEGLKHLAASIKLHGILQPLLLRREEDGSLRIVAGERRWRAAGLAGLQEVPARILTASEAEARELSLIENVQRKDLSPIEVASALATMIERSSLTQEECADRLGWSRALVANRLRLLKLPDEVRGLLAAGRITEGHARALLGAESDARCVALGLRAADGAMTVRQLEEAVRLPEEDEPPAPETPAPPRGRFQALRLPRPLRDFRRRGIKIRVGRRSGAGRIVLDGLQGVDDAQLLEALETCLRMLYPEEAAR